jgi:selenide, water dikinase
VEHLSGTVVVGEIEADDLHVREELLEAMEARIVRPVATADEQRALVEPDRVPALDGRGKAQLAGEGHARLHEVDAHLLRFAAPSFLAGHEEHGARIGYERGIVGVDGIRVRAAAGLAEDDLRACFLEERAKRLVLGLQPGRVGLRPPAVGAPGRPGAGRRRLDEHALEPSGHALTPKRAGGNLHRVETTARLAGLEAGGGCAAKYAAGRLEELLAGFAPADSENLLVGLSPADDAAVYRLDDERALIFTTDFFPPMVDDPAVFGAVAAVNALNDVFAMGGKPLLALSVAAFPEELPIESVRAVFDAAAAKVEEAGALLAGGHTIRDDEPKYGLAVVGTVHPDAIWRKNGARPGDFLYLTKPLGTGLVLTGVRKKVLGDEELQGAAATMTELNDRAAETVRPFEPSAVTDVTGFGLFGHAHEMAERSGVSIVLDPASFPALPGALAVARRGLRTGGDPRNREFVAGAARLDGLPEELGTLGFDPQTAGGLLVSLPAEKSAVLEAAFADAGLPLARVGQVVEGTGLALA